MLTLIACLVVLLAADIYLHHKYERTASVNVWGYRGPTVGPKQPLETRIAVFGGSTAFGYGPDWDGSFPYLMEQRLNALTSRPGRFVVVNLGYNNDGAFAFRPTMEDYEYPLSLRSRSSTRDTTISVMRPIARSTGETRQSSS